MFQVIQKIIYLQLLASQTQDRNAPNIGMICISREQCTESGGILASAAATACMIEKFDAIYIFKEPVLVSSVYRV